MHWLQPLAWWGLAGIAIPILIHLLARDRSRRFLFPSLKFLQVNQVAAMRRRVVSNWPLLVVRVLIVVMSVAALAGPVFISKQRKASWNQRVARAIVAPVEQRERVASLVAEETRTSFVAASFSSAVLADAVTEAIEWFRRQPPAARELVIVGDLRDGALTDRELESVPPSAGIRFLPAARVEILPRATLSAVADGPGGELTAYQISVEADALATRVRYAPGSGDQEHEPQLRLVADPAAQGYADALRRAVLRGGVWLASQGDRRVTLVFRGAASGALSAAGTPSTTWIREALARNPELRGGEIDGALTAGVDMPVTANRAPDLVARVVRVVFSQPFDAFEPRRLTPATLARWSRPPGESPDDIQPADEGDRRWFWGAVSMLLAVEQFARAKWGKTDSATRIAAEERVA